MLLFFLQVHPVSILRVHSVDNCVLVDDRRHGQVTDVVVVRAVVVEALGACDVDTRVGGGSAPLAESKRVKLTVYNEL
jgi:hypothetical protein